MKTPAFVDAVNVKYENGKYLMTLPMYSGNILKEVTFEGDKTLVVAVRSGACKKEVCENAKSGEVKKEKAADKNLFTKIAEIVQEISETVNLEEAEVIVSGGRGMGSKENFELVKQLAEVCGGVVGATRPATEDEWIPRSHQVGQSGKIVAPKLYIACGISGATQHVSGIMGSNYIVAINKDEDAPIFDVADVGIVGNVMDIIPIMIEEIKKIKESDNCYQLIKRSGFVNSSSYSEQAEKRKQVYMLSSGSVLNFKPEGKILDLSLHGNHSIYRMGKPIVLGVKIWVI